MRNGNVERRLLLGTQGWQRAEWIGSYYPADLPPDWRLAYYANDCGCEPEVDPRWGTFPRRSWDTTCWVADIGKIKSVLGWTPETDLRSGLQKTLEWFRLNPEYFDYYRRCLELTGSAA